MRNNVTNEQQATDDEWICTACGHGWRGHERPCPE